MSVNTRVLEYLVRFCYHQRDDRWEEYAAVNCFQISAGHVTLCFSIRILKSYHEISEFIR